MGKSCHVSDCNKPSRARGYCMSHYHRLVKYGDPRRGSTAAGVPMRFIHEVVMKHTGDECLTWPYAKGAGYGKVMIGRKLTLVSRYVCELTHGAPPTPEHEAAHSCGNGGKSCVSPSHLSWKTRAENSADRFVHGTDSRGERNCQAKLTRDAVLEIKSLEGKMKPAALAEIYGVSDKTISDIYSGRTWSWLHESRSGLDALVRGASI